MFEVLLGSWTRSPVRDGLNTVSSIATPSKGSFLQVISYHQVHGHVSFLVGGLAIVVPSIAKSLQDLSSKYCQVQCQVHWSTLPGQ